MREVAFIDGNIRNTPSDIRRFESPQPSVGPSFGDLLSQVESPQSNTTTQNRIDTSHRNQPSAQSPQERESSYESDPQAELSHEEAATRQEPTRESENRDHLSRESVKEQGARERESATADERVAQERNEANQLRAEEAQKQVAANSSSGGEVQRQAQEAASSDTEEEELAKLAVGEALPQQEKQIEGALKEPERVSDTGGRLRLGAAGRGGSAAGANGGEDALSVAEASAKNSGRLQEPEQLVRAGGTAPEQAAQSEERGSQSVAASQLSGGKAMIRELTPVASGQEPVSDEIRQKAERALADLDSRERADGAERKLRIVDLRAPREGRNRGDGGAEQNGEGGSRNGLKEAGQNRLFEGAESNTVRFEGAESAFGRQLGSVQSDRGEGIGQRLVEQQQQLHRFLQDKGYGEIVRNARVMLREGGNGELRLNLTPKELGSVRIQLQLQDSHIAGRIIVENSTVREVFEQNLEQLQRAFQSQGLETGRLEVAVEQRGEGRERRGRGDTGRDGGAQIFEEHTARLPDAFYEDAQVNLMA